MERGELLKTTGPLARLQRADQEHFLRELKAIVKQAKGVVFEGDTLARVQGAAERFGLNVQARLSSKRNDPIADIYVEWRGNEIGIQLKTGSDRYLRDSLTKVAAREDGTWVLTQSDVSDRARAAGARTQLSFDDVDLPSPTLEDLESMAERDLERLSRGEATVDHFDIARNAVLFGLVDGLAAFILDWIRQAKEEPSKPFDWRRSAGIFFKRAATSTAAGIVAGSGTGYALSLTPAAVDATTCLRAARAVGVVLPRAFASYGDYRALREGEIESRDFQRRLARQAGALTVEWSAFQLASRYAIGLGPIGQFAVLLGGSLLADQVGGGIADFLFSLFTTPASTATVKKIVEQDVQVVEKEIRSEEDRRRKLAAQRLCEEPSCNRDHHARGFCSRHYQRWYRRNRPYLVLVEGRLVTTAQSYQMKQQGQ